jgi:hypothetical protein
MSYFLQGASAGIIPIILSVQKCWLGFRKKRFTVLNGTQECQSTSHIEPICFAVWPTLNVQKYPVRPFTQYGGSSLAKAELAVKQIVKTIAALNIVTTFEHELEKVAGLAPIVAEVVQSDLAPGPDDPRRAWSRGAFDASP